MRLNKMFFAVPLVLLVPLCVYTAVLFIQLKAKEGEDKAALLNNDIAAKDKVQIEQAVKRLESTIKETLIENSRLTQANEELKKKASRLEAAIPGLIRLNRDLKAESEKLPESQQEAIEAKNEADRLKKEAAILKKTNKDLMDKVNENSREIGALSEENKKIKSAKGILTLEQEMESYKQCLMGSEENLNKSLKKMAEVIKKNSTLAQESSRLHYNLGCIFFKDKDYKMAIGEFNHSISLNAKNPEAHYNLGVIYGDYLGDNNQAISNYKKYLELSPNASDEQIVKEKISSAKLKERSMVNSPIEDGYGKKKK